MCYLHIKSSATQTVMLVPLSHMLNQKGDKMESCRAMQVQLRDYPELPFDVCHGRKNN